jgi:hypothetical protein
MGPNVAITEDIMGSILWARIIVLFILWLAGFTLHFDLLTRRGATI